jgi:dihydrolipoamide dehydrogenase
VEVRIPDIGDFAEVPVIEIHVAQGDTVAAEDPLITLESDKATMDVPAPAAGTVQELNVSLDDKVSEGDAILTLETSEEPAEEAAAPEPEPKDEPSEPEPKDEPSEPEPQDQGEEQPREPEPEQASAAEKPEGRVVVIGSGPGGYAAAFRAADLGLEVVLVERFETLGGVCLNVGCIPSKALLHAARVIAETEEASAFGLAFERPGIDLDRMRDWKNEVVGKLTGGLTGLARQRKVKVVTGTAAFTSDRAVDVDGTSIDFDHCVIAAGSRAAMLPGLPEDERIGDSTDALELHDVPERLLVIGGGIIGLEMATVYEALGSAVSVVELTDQLIPECDRDLVKPLQDRISDRYEAVMLSTKVSSVEAGEDGIRVTFEGEGAPEPQTYDRVLVAVGRQANGDRLDLDRAGVDVDEHGVIPVDGQRRTNVPHVYAIGDVAGSPMLAHKATHEGKTAAEVIAGRKVEFDPRAIPSVAYTDPEVAWTGLTETEAVASNTEYEKAVFPWQASGRALALGRPDGMTKILVEPETRRVLGMGIVGVNAGDLIAEATLAIEMGADAEDVALTIHPHPTLSESVAFAAESVEGTITDLYVPRRKGR